ncbi:MAG: PH domain-containing protein [Actinomycetota bacterium]|nr:PH domain-containing protein [Actinomycetota bacterium]MDP3631035.1 PH domain-containing protein [Actinomycetota bacterium]
MRLILVALPIIELRALAGAVRDGDGEAIMGTAVACGIVAAIYGLLVIPVRYGLSSDRLVIRFGVVRRYIDLAAIREVYRTHNPLSSPALSLDRLAIRTGDGLSGMSLISPAEREEFLLTLASSTGLVLNNDRLVRPRSGSP